MSFISRHMSLTHRIYWAMCLNMFLPYLVWWGRQGAVSLQLWRACNLTSFSPCLTGPVDYLFASRHKGPRFKSPGGYLSETGILLLVLSRYTGDPDVIDHFWGLDWGGLHPELSLGPHVENVIIPLDLTQLFSPGLALAAGPASSFTTNGVGCWGGALWRACNLTSFSPCLTGPVDFLFASRHRGSRFKFPGGYLCETGILLLALSRYTALHFSHQLKYDSNLKYNWYSHADGWRRDLPYTHISQKGTVTTGSCYTIVQWYSITFVVNVSSNLSHRTVQRYSTTFVVNESSNLSHRIV